MHPVKNTDSVIACVAKTRCLALNKGNLFMKKLTVLFIAALTLAACSKGSREITPTYVSPAQYSNYECDQIRQELVRVNGIANQMAGKLDDNKETDDAVTAAGIILFWPALFFLGGTSEEESEYARLRGEYNALEQASIQKKCSS